jgi:signal transduction histidine kinase
MQTARQERLPTIEREWAQSSLRVLTFSTLTIICFLLGAGISQVIPLLNNQSLPFPLVTLLILGIALIWLLIALAIGRTGRFVLAGWMVVLLTLIIIALLLYSSPEQLTFLLPLIALPPIIAALLLSTSGILLTVALTLITTVGAIFVGTSFPARFALLPNVSETTLSLGVTITLLVILAMCLGSLRGRLQQQFERTRERYRQLAKLEQSLQLAQVTRNDALDQSHRIQQHFEGIVAQITDGALTVDSTGQITRANRSAHDLWASATVGSLIGQPFDRVRSVFSQGEQNQRLAQLLELPPDQLPGSEGYTHLLIDQREQVRFQRLRTELLTMLTDEMRNPLTSMVTALDLTLDQANLPEDVDRVLGGARRSGRRLIDLVTLLLEMDQIEQKRDTLRQTTMPFRRVLEAGIAQMAPLAQQNAVTLTVEYNSEPVVMIDGERIQRAFVYQLEQALRHSPPYSTVQIRIEKQNGSVVVRIVDQGTGEHSTPSLGLAFSKLVIEAHGGRAWSERLNGQGNLYAFSLPTDRGA